MSLVNKKGVDISVAQGNVDMDKIKADVYSFVMVYCGFGNDEADHDNS